MRNSFDKNIKKTKKKKSCTSQKSMYRRASKFSYGYLDHSFQKYESLKQVNNKNIIDDEKQMGGEQIFNLSKIHLNVINILNKCPSEEFCQIPSFQNNTNNKSIDKINKRKKSIFNNNRKNEIKKYMTKSEINNGKVITKNKNEYFNSRKSINLNNKRNSIFKNIPTYKKYYSHIEKDNSNINPTIIDFPVNNKKTPLAIGRRSVFNFQKHNLFNFKRKISNNNNQNNKIESNKHVFGQLSDIEILKINNHIHNDLKNIQLKKQITRLRKKLKLKYSKKK